MKVTSAKKFSENQKELSDLAESERDENTETDLFFSDPQILNAIKEGIEDVKAGRVTSIRDLKNIRADIL
jgi:PHD/YefM family antitoxin component YafN of YafNO toxin-antitoxin module